MVLNVNTAAAAAGGNSTDSVNNISADPHSCIDSKDIASVSLAELLADNKSSLRCAFILHVETTLVSLLNIIMYRQENCREMDDHVAVALTDYCARQMVS